MDRSQTPTRRPSLFTLVVPLVLALLSATIVTPYAYGVGDNRITVPFVKADADPDLYPGDFVIEQRAYYYTFLWKGLALLHRAGVPLPPMFFALYFVALYFTFLAVLLLAVLLFERREAGVLACALFLFGRFTLGGIATIGISLSTRGVALPFVLFALWSFLRGDRRLPYVLLGLAYLFHPLTVHYALAMIAAGALGLGVAAGLRHLAGGMPIFAALASPILIWKLRSSPGAFPLLVPDPAWIDCLRVRSGHHMFLTSFSPQSLVEAAAAVATLLLSYACVRAAKPAVHAVVLRFLAAILALCFAGWLFADVVPLGATFLFQPLRAFVFLECLVPVYLAGAIVLGEERRHPAVYGAALAAAAVWALTGNFHALRGPLELLTIAGAVLAARSAASFRLRPRRIEGSVAALVCIAVVVLGTRSLVRHGHLSVSFGNAQEDEYIDLQQWAREHTGVRDGFVVPPDEADEFRVDGERTVYADWEDGGLMNANPAFGLEWSRRMRALYQDAPGGYCAMVASDYHAIAREMALPGRRVFVVRECPDDPLELPLRYQNDVWDVYEVPLRDDAREPEG